VIERCFCCERKGPVELDHPTGTTDGRHLHPDFTVPLCLSCHRLRSYVDRQLGIDGGSLEGRPWLISRRLGAWFGVLVIPKRAILFDSDLLSWLARVLAEWGKPFVMRCLGIWFCTVAMTRKPVLFGPEVLACLAQALSEWAEL
jgi:hypothetical protein